MSARGARRGKRVALAGAGAALAVITLTIVASWDIVREEWLLHRWTSAAPQEQPGILHGLAALGSTRGMREALLLLGEDELIALLKEQPAALLAVAGSLKDSSAALRLRAATALRGAASHESPQLIPPLTDALHDESPSVRCAAAVALGNIGPAAAGAIPDLLASFQLAAVERLEGKDVRTSCSPFAEALAKIGSPGIETLIELYRDPNDVFRELALASVGRVAPPATPILLASLRSGEESRREFAAEAFCRMPACADAAPALVHSLGDASATVRAPARRALVEIVANEGSAIYLICQRIDREDARVRALVVDCLAGTKASVRAEPLFAKLSQDDQKDVRLRSVRALGLSRCAAGASAAIDGLLKALLVEKDRRVRQEAFKALVLRGAQSAPALVEALESRDPETRHQAAVALGELGLGAEAAIPSLLKLLRDPDEDLRFQAMQVLGGLGPLARDAAPVLSELVLAAPTPAARMRAESALRLVSEPGSDAK